MKASVKRQKNLVINVTDEEISANLNTNLKRAVDLAKEKRASVWLTALPIEEHSFLLKKSEFHDAICLRYGWQPVFLPDFCPCEYHVSVDHSLSCPTGGFPTLRHNETRDIVANLLDDVCHDVQKQPILQKLTGEILPQKSNSTDDEARLDISACGFWGGRFQKTYFDVRIFNPHAQSYR